METELGITDGAARAWRLLAHFGHAVDLDAAAAALAVSTSTARRWRDEVRAAGLVTRDGAAWVHRDRASAARASRELDDAAEIAQVVRRGLLWLLHGLSAADRWFADRDDQPVLPAPPQDLSPRDFASREQAWAWVAARWDELVPAVRTAVEHGEVALAWQLVAVTFHWAFLAKPWRSWAEAARIADEAARAAGDELGRAWTQHVLARIAGDEGDHDAAVERGTRSLQLRRRLGERRDAGWSALALAQSKTARGDPEVEIAPLLDETVEAHREIGMLAGVCLGSSFRAQLAARRGALDEAEHRLREVAGVVHGTGDPAIEVHVRTRLGEVLVGRGRLEQARGQAALADERAREAGADWFRIDALICLADCGPDGSSREALRAAARIAGELGDPRAERLRTRLAELGS